MVKKELPRCPECRELYINRKDIVWRTCKKCGHPYRKASNKETIEDEKGLCITCFFEDLNNYDNL